MKTIHDNPLTAREMILMMILFLFGSSVVMGVNSECRQDSWISLLIGAAMALPLFVMYARILQLMNGQDFFTCVIDWFGPIAGRIVIGLLVWYYIYLAAIVIRNFSEFMEIAAMPETPQFPLMISILMVCVYLCKSRIQVIGQWSVVGLYLTLVIVTITVLATTRHMDAKNLLPILEYPPSELVKNGVKTTAFPYAECVVFLPLVAAARRANPYHVFLKGHLLGTVVLLITVLRNILCIGPALMQIEYFPSYTCARIMEIGDFLSRIEGTISVNFIIAGTSKATLCLYAGCLGTAKILNMPSKMDLIVMPLCMLTLTFCVFSYVDAIQMFDFIDVYPIFAMPFQLILPALIWIVGEWKTRQQKDEPAPAVA